VTVTFLKQIKGGQGMNDFHAIARAYFRQVEGWHLYRAQGDRLLWLWVALVCLGVLCFVWPLGNAIRRSEWVQYGVWLGVILVIEVVVLRITLRIVNRKSAALIAEVARQHSVVMKSEQECRAFLLTKLLERPADKFFGVAKEISDLLKLRQEFLALHEIEPEQFWKSVYDRDSKPRLIAVTLGAITLFTALTIRSIPEGPSLFDVLTSEDSLTFVKKLLALCASLFVLLVLARVVVANFWHVATTWWTKSVSSKESRTALRHLARDLVLFHKPVVKNADVGVGIAAAAASEDLGQHHAGSQDENLGGFSRALQLGLVGAVILGGVLGAQRRRSDKRG
jgi:hypothetical protein